MKLRTWTITQKSVCNSILGIRDTMIDTIVRSALCDSDYSIDYVLNHQKEFRYNLITAMEISGTKQSDSIEIDCFHNDVFFLSFIIHRDTLYYGVVHVSAFLL